MIWWLSDSKCEKFHGSISNHNEQKIPIHFHSVSFMEEHRIQNKCDRTFHLLLSALWKFVSH